MAFQINGRELPTLSSWIVALSRWESVKPWRGGDPNIRPIQERTRKGQMILKGHDDSVICRLYNTNVVTYHKNGDIELHAYGSVSTDAFANAVLPTGIYTQFNHTPACVALYTGDSPWLDPDTRYYPIKNSMLLRRTWAGGHWMPVNHEDRFTDYVLDKKAAREALKKYPYADFVAFMTMRVGMGHKPNHRIVFDTYKLGNIFEMLTAGPSAWTKHVMEYRETRTWHREAPDNLKELFEKVRMAIYQKEGVVSEQKLEFVTSQNALKAIHKRRQTYQYIARD